MLNRGLTTLSFVVLQTHMHQCSLFKLVSWYQLFNGTDPPGYLKVANVPLTPNEPHDFSLASDMLLALELTAKLHLPHEYVESLLSGRYRHSL